MTDKNIDPKKNPQFLEEIVHMTNKVGLAYVQAKKKAEYLDLMRAPTRAKIAHKLDDGSLSEAKLKRLVDMDEQYISFLQEMVEAKRECDELKIRYESYKNLFDARRSMLSYQKEEMKLL